MNLQTIPRSPMALAVALAMACSTVPLLAHAADAAVANDTVSTATMGVQRDLMRLSDEGRQAMISVREARMALFNGDPRLASDALTRAQAMLKVAKVDEPIEITDVTTSVGGKVVAEDLAAQRGNLVPIDGRVMVDENFVKSATQKTHVAKAGEHLKQGRTKEAANELKLAEVDASYSRVLMPLQTTRKLVNEAATFVGEKKYYDANLALKAAEDGLMVDSVIVSEAPKAAKAPASKTQK